VRCSRCGNENPETNRFCGMCGATLLQTPAAVPKEAGQSKESAGAPVESPHSAPPTVPAPHPQTQPAEITPVISGPSFLGLNEPAPSPRRRGSLSIDPHSAPSSGNLDYLLEDEESSGGGAGKIVLVLIALTLALGFGYLRWKNQGLPWLGSSATKPSAAAQTSDAPDTGPAAPAASSVAPAASAGPAAAPPNTSSPATPDSAAATPASSSGAAAPAPAPAAGDAATANGVSGTATPPAPVSGDAPPATAAARAAPVAAEKPEPAPKPRLPKPLAAMPPPKALDPISEAQKYIYGRHVPQDCDRGLRLLKPAAEQANPKAMIEMGALYSAGLCAPRDLPTAYRWFALALRKDPDNQALQADLQKLWGEMTQPERQLAIKLSQ